MGGVSNGSGLDERAGTGEGLDLSECEREPIHLLGHIQPHGCLLALAAEDPRGPITHISANSRAVLGAAPDSLLGRDPDAVLDGPVAALLRSRAAPYLGDGSEDRTPPPSTEVHTLTRQGATPRWAVTAHRSGRHVVIEIEPVPATAGGGKGDGASGLGAGDHRDGPTAESDPPSGPRIGAAPHRLEDETVQAVADVTGYDRVMLYMFHPDWSGEVVAETRRPDMAPYLGLRYPASDIPPQALRLFTVNPLRIIADVAAEPIPVLCEGSEDGGADDSLDLTHSVLRSVSPYHIEYLENMEVAATLTASVIVDGALWGMIACHHLTPRRITPDVRAAVADLARRLATCIEAQQRRAKAEQRQATERYLTQLRNRLASGEPLPQALLGGAARLWDPLGAEGGMLAVGESLALVGLCPTADETRAALAGIGAQSEAVVMTDRLADHLDGPGSDVAGLAVAVLSRDPLIAIGVFRPPEAQEVFWAGDPAKPAVQEPGRDRISPRRSFAAWKEAHRDRAKPWDETTHDTLAQIARVVRDHLPAADPLATLGPDIESLKTALTSETTQTVGGFAIIGDGLALTVEKAEYGGSGVERIETVNRAFLDVFGETEPGEDLAAVMDRIGLPADAGARSRDGAFAFECWSRRRGRRTLQIAGWPVLTIADQAGARTWRALSFRDITETRRAQDTMASARDRAELGARMKTEFLSRVGHDLKTPINAILGFSDMIRLGVGTSHVDDKVVEYAGIIHDAGAHLLGMIEELLELSRFQLGSASPGEQSFDLTDLCRECLDWIKAYPGAAALTLSAALPASAVAVQADRIIFARMILNLLSNAVKFTPAGGTVNLRLRLPTEGGAVIEVSDSGIGIPPTSIREIFLPFRRGEGPEVAEREGTGLGLTMVKTMIEAYGGRIEVTSAPGDGSPFSLILPADRCEG
jgi:light-regulated signal transduction histidine kinase (bacteriophytochrome)